MFLNMGLNTFGMCDTQELFKHVFRHGVKHIPHLRQSRNCLNMCSNVALGRVTLRELAQVCLNMFKRRPSHV